MKKRRSFVASAVAIVVLALAWLTLAPRQLGGPLSYVITSGTSMEPHFFSGDLAIVRQQSQYSVGDIVAYHNQQLDNILLHRIIRIDGDRYVFKGDNNDFVDAFHPTLDDLVGKLWLHIPRGGQWLTRARSPKGAAILAGVVGLMAAGGASQTKRSGSRERSRSGSTHFAYRALPILAALVVLFAIFGAIAFKRAPDALTRSNLGYTQSGKFSYTATSSSPAVYEGGRVTTGQPLFTKLVHDMIVSFTYHFDSTLPHDLSGTQTMRVELLDDNGYKRFIQESAPQKFSGSNAKLEAAISLDQIEALSRVLERETGVPRSSDIISVTPTTKISGSLDGQQLKTTYSPPLSFQFDALQMQLVASSTSDGTTTSALEPSQSASLPVLSKRQSDVDVAFIHMHVRTARVVAIAAVGGCLLLLLILGIPLRRAMNRNEVTRLEIKHGSLFVPLRNASFPSGKSRIEVASIDSLVQIAYGYEKLILHSDDGGVHRYVVESDGVLYTYEADDSTYEADDSTYEADDSTYESSEVES